MTSSGAPIPAPIGSPAGREPLEELIPADALVVQMTEFRFSPAVLRVLAGAQVTLAAVNSGQFFHSLTFVDVRIDSGSLRPGRTRLVSFMAPAERRVYRFVCTEEGHEEEGMIGELIVE